MSDPFVGQIQPFAIGYAPKGWLECNGALLPIRQFSALFSLLGTQFGGDGINNFALPDLRGRVPIGQGTSPRSGAQYVIGQYGGAVAVTLSGAQVPTHYHALIADSAAASAPGPNNNHLAQPAAPHALYAPGSSPLVPLNPSSLDPAGGGQPHDNRQPTSVIAFYIAWTGLYPSRQ